MLVSWILSTWTSHENFSSGCLPFFVVLNSQLSLVWPFSHRVTPGLPEDGCIWSCQPLFTLQRETSPRGHVAFWVSCDLPQIAHFHRRPNQPVGLSRAATGTWSLIGFPPLNTPKFTLLEHMIKLAQLLGADPRLFPLNALPLDHCTPELFYKDINDHKCAFDGTTIYVMHITDLTPFHSIILSPEFSGLICIILFIVIQVFSARSVFFLCSTLPLIVLFVTPEIFLIWVDLLTQRLHLTLCRSAVLPNTEEHITDFTWHF